MSRRVSGEAEALSALAQDLVQDGRRNAGAAEAAAGEVIAVVNEAADGFRHGHDFIG